MTYSTLLTEVSNGIALVAINRPDVRNAVNRQVPLDIRATLADFRDDDHVAVVVFTGAGEKAFVAGAGIAQVRQHTMLTSLVPGDELLTTARDIAGQIMAKGPLAVRLAKLVIRSGMDSDQLTGLVVEAQALLYTTDDKAEGADAFLARRRPVFQGR